MHLFGVLLLLGMISSCGKSNSNAGIPIVKEKALPVNGSNINGLYMAKFFTVNPGVNGTLPGSATIQRQGDKLFAYVRLFGGGPSAWHQQGIYDGKRCPNAGDDTNRDGYIDMNEGARVWGKLMIPLDSNINSQSAGKNIYPVADATGTYFYERTASFDRMFRDLKSTLLAENEGLAIEGRVVVVQGSAETIVYPETFATDGHHTAAQSAPVTCGVFRKITKVPGTIEQPEPENDDWTRDDLPTDDDVRPTPTPDNSDDDDHDSWIERVIEWWRRRWDRARGNHGTGWGNGGGDD